MIKGLFLVLSSNSIFGIHWPVESYASGAVLREMGRIDVL